MLSCSELKQDISAYIDGELRSDRHGQLSEHLASCSDCQKEFEKIKQTTALLLRARQATLAKCPDLLPGLSEKLPPTCEVVKGDFSAYLDGELVVPARDGVSEHLQKCSPCYEKFQSFSKVNGWLTKALELPASIEIDIWSGVESRLRQDCTLFCEELSPFYDQEAAEDRHRDITSHVLECEPCRQQLMKITQTGSVLREYYQPSIPEDFDLWLAIKDKMKVVPFPISARRRKEAMQRRLYAAAAVLFIGVTATFLTNSYFHPSSIRPTSAESYLIESALGEPIDIAEAVVYENQ